MGDGNGKGQLQADKVQQHLLTALHKNMLQRLQQPCAEGSRCAVHLHLQAQPQGEAQSKHYYNHQI